MGLNKDILILGLNVEWTSGPPLTAKTNIVEANSPNYSESSVLLGIHCIILTKKYVYCWAFKNIFLNLNFSRYGLLVIFFSHMVFTFSPGVSLPNQPAK